MNGQDLTAELETLRESEKHYRVLLDESMDPTFSFYPDGTYRYVNTAFARGVGRPADQIIGFRIWDIFDRQEADKRFAVVKKVFAEGRIVEFEVRVPLPDHDTYYLTTAKPIFGQDGMVETVICTSKNITKRKIAEMALTEERDKLMRALEEIRELSGLLPICASCKSVRDDQGYWSKIETYLSKHANVELTHSLCPTCYEELYRNEVWYQNKR